MAIETFLVHTANPEPRAIRLASDALLEGKVVLVPTETGYCFVGDPRLASTQKLFLQLRPNHPEKKPFGMLCKDLAQISNFAIMNTAIFRIATRVFPGPYTFILECNRNTPRIAAGPKRKQVGVRISSNAIARSLLSCFGYPLLITSITDSEELENEDYFSIHPHDPDSWWTNVQEIAKRFPQNLALILESDEPVPLKVSTVIDFTEVPPVLVRDGGWDENIFGLISQ